MITLAPMGLVGMSRGLTAQGSHRLEIKKLDRKADWLFLFLFGSFSGMKVQGCRYRENTKRL